MKQDFLDAVESKKLAKVRISLSNELLLDPRGVSFGEMLLYATNNLPDLFEENKEANYTFLPQDEWGKDFLFDVKNDLDSNFSKEKLAFYETVAKIVLKDKASQIEIEEVEDKKKHRQASNESTINEENLINNPKPRKQINTTYATIAAGGTILTIVGVCVGKTLLTVLGGAALVVGGVLLYNDIRD